MRTSLFHLATIPFFAAISTAGAQASSTQSITFQVDAINQIAFSGSPSLVVNTASAGNQPTDAIANATWAVTTNQSNAKITASINSAMPANVILSVNLTAPSGATSAGAQALSTTAIDLVTGITQVAQAALNVTYTLSATATAGVVASTTRTVTYTITGGT